MSQYEKMLENKMNDEIKLAGLEALVAEELEKHLNLNSDRIRTFEDARREVVTYVEAKCCFENSWIPSRVTRVCVNTPGLFLRDNNASKNAGKQSSGKSIRSKSWSKSESSITGRGKGKENNGKSKGTEGAIQVSKWLKQR